MYMYREKTLDLLPLNKAMKKAASDHDLRWFLSLTDVSVTTLIRNCLKINPEIYEQHKDTIEKVSSSYQYSIMLTIYE